jgi:DNA-binding Lrp family transcriptional regulator
LNEKELEILHLLEQNARMDIKTIAKLIDQTEEEVEMMLKKLEENKVIVTYATVVDWSKVNNHDGVTAMIDVKVTPQRGVGFDEVAERIHRFPEVKALYLVSGTYDLQVVIEGKTMSEIASFVSGKLSALDSVISTTTHFRLKTYKHDGVVFGDDDDDHRMMVSP